MWTDQSRFKVAEDVKYQSMGPGEQTVVLSLNSGQLFTCNETTASFIEAMDGRRSFAEIVDALVEKYEVSRERLHADLAGMANELLAEKLIVATEPTGNG